MPQPPDNDPSSLPLRGSGVPRHVILASHLVFTAYGHWFPNDPRGSGSESIRQEKISGLGAIHPGRKLCQPARGEIKDFYRRAEPRLALARLWFDDAMRHQIAHVLGQCAKLRNYTLYACAICRNHAHVVVRTHRDRSEMIWENLARAARESLTAAHLVPANHPVWSHSAYKVFLYTRDQVQGRIDYVWNNPIKEALPAQRWEFLQSFVAPRSFAASTKGKPNI